MALDFNTKERSKRRKKAAILKTIVILFIILGIGALLYSAPRYPQINVSGLLISGNEIVGTGSIEKLVLDQLQGNYYFFFPKKNIFFYPKEIIQKALLSLDPHINEAQVSFSDFQTLSVRVSERLPQALWCGDSFILTDEESPTANCYFLDKNSFVFAEAPDFSGNTFVRYYGLLRNQSSTTGTTSSSIIGSQFVTESEYKSITFLLDEMAKEDFNVSAAVISENDLLELYLLDGGKLMLTLGRDYGNSFDNFKMLVQSKDFKGKISSGKLRFNYIDLRFGSKLFYRI